jgi:flagellar hook protein FlgE
MSISTIRFTGSSLENIQRGLDVVSNNIANINTMGYKKKQANFQDLVSKASGATTYSGSHVSSIDTDFNQGMIKETGMFTDLALKGNGFFALQNGTGEIFYSRAGHFTLDGELNLVDPNGNYALSVGASRVTLPSDLEAVTINALGEINVKRAGSTEFEYYDQIQLANFANPQGLESVGSNLYRETVSSGLVQFSTAGGVATATESTSIVSGALEASNVDMSTSIVEMMALQRSYQALSKATNTSNEVVQETLGLSR